MNKALDPATQPPAIRSYLAAESALLRELIPAGSRVIDFGCGTGRHLIDLADHITEGVGVDYEASYIDAALKESTAPHLRFVVGDATAVPLETVYDMAVCLSNTWGTMSDKTAVLHEMKRLSPGAGSRLITAYAPTSVPARSEWYANLGHEVLETSEEQLVAAGGFTSEHFSADRLQRLLGPCRLYPIEDIAFVAQF